MYKMDEILLLAVVMVVLMVVGTTWGNKNK